MGTAARQPNNLKRLREAAGWTQEEAAEKFGLSKGGYIKVEDGDRGLKADRIAKAAQIFGVQPADILGTGVPPTPVAAKTDDLDLARAGTSARAGRLMRVFGEVAAGRWLEADESMDVSAFEGAPITPDPRWPDESQFGLVVRGTSINLAAEDGDILHCVDVGASGIAPQSGDLVIVERIQAGGHLRERTAKRYFMGEHGMAQLRPDSDDPKWQEPIDFPYRTVSWTDTEGLQVDIKAVVVGAYRPMQRRR